MEVCGIDPGLGTSGYGIICLDGSAPTIRDAGICRTDSDASLPQRLAQIETDFTAICDQWRPDVMGVEQLYSHYAHPRTAILMGHARGVILMVAAQFDIPVRSFAATEVKRHLTGNGRASKTQMQRAIMSAFSLATLPEPNDVADALAVALCCAHAMRNEETGVMQP